MEPTDTASKNTSHRYKKALYKSSGEKSRSKSRLTFGGLVTVKEHNSKVTVVHGCFTEGGDSILGQFFCDPLRINLQDELATSFLTI